MSRGEAPATNIYIRIVGAEIQVCVRRASPYRPSVLKVGPRGLENAFSEQSWQPGLFGHGTKKGEQQSQFVGELFGRQIETQELASAAVSMTTVSV